MYYLNKACFKPAVFVLTVLFVPALVALTICYILETRLSVLIILLSFISIYILTIMLFLFSSKNKKNYMKLEKNYVYIESLTMPNNVRTLKLQYDEIISFEHYSPFSLKSWLGLFCCVLPNLVYLNYNQEGKKNRIVIGYLSEKTLKKICKENSFIMVKH